MSISALSAAPASAAAANKLLSILAGGCSIISAKPMPSVKFHGAVQVKNVISKPEADHLSLLEASR